MVDRETQDVRGRERFEPCEFDPIRNAPAYDTFGHGCPNEATLCVGANGLWHLCASCAALPMFKRLKKTPLPGRAALADARSDGGVDG